MKKKLPVEKNKEYIVDIIDNGYEGEGIAKIDDYTVFIPQTIKGEKVKVLIVKVNLTYAFGKVLEIIKHSGLRVQGDCSTYPRCGGCNLRHMNYQSTLELKQAIVQNLVNKTLTNKIEVNFVIGMDNPYHYRNKAQYPVGYDKNGNIITGIYANRTHDIIPIKNCAIQTEISQEIVKFVIEFMKKNKISAYDENTHQGLIRHIMVRVGFKTDEVMCVFVLNGKQIPKEKELVQALVEKFPNIKTIIKNINIKHTNVILGEETITLYGKGYIEDKLGKYIFEISPLSFYQINPIQTEKLYQTAMDLAKLSKEDIALDLYCGIGTIGIFISSYVKQVYGIEIVEQAILDAKKNAKRNEIHNIQFFSGDVEKILEKTLKENNIFPNIVFVDPPRKGLDKNTIHIISQLMPKKIIYISCNPATLMRDLKELEMKYEIEQIQPVDMFPFTSHVECCSVLYLKDSI